MASEQTAELLASTPLFADLNATELARIVRLLRPAVFQAKGYLCRQGEAGDRLFVVSGGEAEVSVRGADGTKLRLAQLGAGDIVGEMNVVDGSPRAADVVALTTVKTFCLERAALAGLMVQRDPAAFKILRRMALTICSRLRKVNAIVTAGMPRSRPQPARTPAPARTVTSEPSGIRADTWSDYQKEYRKATGRKKREDRRKYWTGMLGKLVGG